ncbi:MAG: transcriptional repressor [Planctomycetales bacterium]|nr:transcriptional repressor [Planctomycetales bacterium]
MGHETETFREFLARRGLRLTRQREQVLAAVLAAREHLSADDYFDRLRARGVSKSTIYRTLSLLVESGLAEGQDYGDGRVYYERMAGRDHHDHLICLGCGDLTEFRNADVEKLQDRVADEHGFELVSHTHKLFGYCARCRRERRGAAAGLAARAGTGRKKGRMRFFR